MSRTIRRLSFAILVATAIAVFAQEEHDDSVRQQQESPPDDRITIVTTSGTEYLNCRITRVEPDGISIMHSRGIAKIPFAELPEQFRDQYGYNPEQAAQYSRAAAQHRAAAAAERDEAARRARQRADHEASRRESLDTIKKTGIEIVGRIQQITDDGALISDAKTPQQYQQEVTTPGFRPMDGNRQFVTRTRYLPVSEEYEPIFVISAGRGRTDGSAWKATVYPAGTYQYTSVMGAGKTIRCFALTPEGALDYLMRNR